MRLDADGILGYAVAPRKRHGLGYWFLFFGACLVVGLPIANILDDSIKMHLTGIHADGGATILSLLDRFDRPPVSRSPSFGETDERLNYFSRW
jgi:hypothetical protein